jgi:nucleolar pre-ribosomal-associated protein 2
LNAIGKYIKNGFEAMEQSNAAIYHGKEEWLLKWLLKKLQASEDVEPRYASFSHVEALP